VTTLDYLTSNKVQDIPIGAVRLGRYRLRRVCPTPADDGFAIFVRKKK